jgi:uncharacterized protein YecE (DUF72 family)
MGNAPPSFTMGCFSTFQFPAYIGRRFSRRHHLARVWIGVSGWQYPDFTDRFYPKDLETSEQLGYYASQFFTVEINNTFYQLPTEQTVRHWYDQVGEDFLFAIKASRYITHMKNLLEPEDTLPNFFERISLLKEKIGPILFQLPPYWQLNLERLQNFLKFLKPDYRYTFELRNKTWLNEDIYSLLRDNNIAFCIYEINYRQSPLMVTADFVYIRLHGPGRAYNDPYDMDTLGLWANRIEDWVGDGKDVYCYFDNTHRGYAWENAKSLMDLLD